MDTQDTQHLWNLFDHARHHDGDAAARLLLKTAIQSAFLDGIYQASLDRPDVRQAILLDPRKINLASDIERWWSSIGVSDRYADASMAFYCFEKALELTTQKGRNLVSTDAVTLEIRTTNSNAT